MTPRTAQRSRTTSETSVAIALTLDGTGQARISSGVSFLDHMLMTLARHSRMDLELTCSGDLAVDDHHTVEDCALTLGGAIDAALGDRAGIVRFGSAYAPLDESLSRVVVDLSGRPVSVCVLQLQREQLGGLSCENVPHFFASLATTLRAAIHVDVLRGENDHHRVESAFKALALALRAAWTRDGSMAVPSTKGVLA